MPIRAITFDLDDTLLDFTVARDAALDRAVALAGERRAELAGRLVASTIQDRWEGLAAEALASGEEVRLADIRHRSFAVALAGLDVTDAALTDELVERYFHHRHGDIRPYDDAAATLEVLAGTHVLGVITNGNTDGETHLPGRFSFRLSADQIGNGLRKPDPRLFHMAAAAAGCRIGELVHVGDNPDQDVAAAQAAGARSVWVDRGLGVLPPDVRPDATIAALADLPAALARLDRAPGTAEAVGVGPHPRPWPEDSRLDPALLAGGDRRNVADRYRYWTVQAIRADLDQRRHPFHVAIENWRHDLNIGTVVRTANAFLAAEVHIVGGRRWNRRGAMATDVYQHVRHHPTVDDLASWAAGEGLPIVGVDIVDGAVPIETATLPEQAVLLFGQEGPGLSEAARRAAGLVCSISQFGSTRSLNAGVAAGIAMHAWVRQHAPRRVPGPAAR